MVIQAIVVSHRAIGHKPRMYIVASRALMLWGPDCQYVCQAPCLPDLAYSSETQAALKSFNFEVLYASASTG